MNENVPNRFDPFAILDEARLQRQVNSIAGGGGSALTITDGTTTVEDVAQITVIGGTVGGSSPDATVTISGGGFVGFTSSLDTTAPNDTVNASHLQASGGTTDQDAVISPAGLGAFQLTEATGDSTGGNKRGVNAVDLQIWPATPGKTSPTAVASGANSFAVGFGSTASGAFAVAMGNSAGAFGDNSVAIGNAASAGDNGSIAIGTGAGSGGPGDVTIKGTGVLIVGGGSGNFSIDLSGLLHSELNGVAWGFDSPATGVNSFTIGGLDSVADGNYSGILIGSNSWTRGITGYVVIGLNGTPGPTGSGAQQLGLLGISNSTTDATPTVLTSDTAAPSTTNQAVLPDNSSYSFYGRVMGRQATTADSASWEFVGLINRASGAATTALVAVVTPTQIAATGGASTWSLAVTADTTNGAIQVTAAGAMGSAISWIGRIETEELAW